MGTNYYHRTNICDCCGRYDAKHICKSMTTFQAIWEWGGEYDCDQIVTVSSWQQWKERLLADGEVWDEYGEKWDIEKFIADVESTEVAWRRRQYDWCLAHPQRVESLGEISAKGEWIDADGFSFSGGGFS